VNEDTIRWVGSMCYSEIRPGALTFGFLKLWKGEISRLVSSIRKDLAFEATQGVLWGLYSPA